MAVYLARPECRGGFWHVVTYEISTVPWRELLAIPTPAPCGVSEPSIVIGDPVPEGTPKPTGGSGECEGASLNSFSETWTTTTSYTTVAADAECPAPSARAMAEGIRDAKERFGEVADEYCLLQDCADGELCLYSGSKLDVSFQGIVSKTVGREKDCFLKFEISGELGCTCQPGPKRRPRGKPKREKPARRKVKKGPAKKARPKR